VPLLPLLALLLLPVAVILTMPLALVQRYRVGTARRAARPWLVTLNFGTIVFSALLFLWAAALTNFWVPNAFRFALAGLAAGILLGLLGLALTRWERGGASLHYTPNRWLVLLITLAVTLRLLYGFWRSWHAWQTSDSTASWLANSGVPGSMAVGALVLGYYAAYAAGLWRRVRRRKRLELHRQ
jgi:hypothetical protein